MFMKRSSGLKDLWRITSVFFELKKEWIAYLILDRIAFMKNSYYGSWFMDYSQWVKDRAIIWIGLQYTIKWNHIFYHIILVTFKSYIIFSMKPKHEPLDFSIVNFYYSKKNILRHPNFRQLTLFYLHRLSSWGVWLVSRARLYLVDSFESEVSMICIIYIRYKTFQTLFHWLPG